MMTIETLKQNIEKSLGRREKHALWLTKENGKMRIVFPAQVEYESDMSYAVLCVYPWCAVGYEIMRFIRANNIKLEWERRQSPKTIIACDCVGSIDGKDIICYKHQGFDVGKDFLAESFVVIDDLAELLLQHIAPDAQKPSP